MTGAAEGQGALARLLAGTARETYEREVDGTPCEVAIGAALAPLAPAVS